MSNFLPRRKKPPMIEQPESSVPAQEEQVGTPPKMKKMKRMRKLSPIAARNKRTSMPMV